jgi:hypothetical protein
MPQLSAEARGFRDATGGFEFARLGAVLRD